MELQGKRAIVTGGGTGIGRGIVERFIEEGAQVATVQRRELPPDMRDQPSIHSIRADLADVSSFSDVIAGAVSALGGIDILVNNAGVMFERAVSTITVEDWDTLMAINLRAPMFLAQAALPHLLRNESAAIVNIGSIEGLGVNPEHTAYSASKGGLHALTRALAVDLGPNNIRVNTVAPGWIETDMSSAFFDSTPNAPAARERLRTIHPLGRTGSPRDIGDVVVFLASDRSRFLTGQTIVADGGRMTKLSHPGSTH